MTVSTHNSLIAAALLTAVMAAPAIAQQTTGNVAPSGVRTDDRSNNSNWGWLGLLGLGGLAPLFMRKDRQGNVHADTRT